MTARRFGLLLPLTLAVLVACGVDDPTDAFARRVLHQLRTRDSAVQRDLDPRSPIARVPWSELQSRTAAYFPDSTVTPVLIDRESGTAPDIGRYRRLTYFLGHLPDSAVAELWIVERDGRLYLNTLRTSRY